MRIPAAKLAGLRQCLDHDGAVRFKNGATISVEAHGHLRVRWPSDRRGVPITDLSSAGFRRAYELALTGPPPRMIAPVRQLRGDGSRFGDTPPF